MKSIILLLATLSMFSSNAFYIRCSGPNDMEILIATNNRNVSESPGEIRFEDAFFEYKASKNARSLSGWGEGSIINGKTVFTGDDVSFEHTPYNPVHGDQNHLIINGFNEFENISVSCNGKF